MATIKCSRCLILKAASEYRKGKLCRECENARNRERRCGLQKECATCLKTYSVHDFDPKHATRAKCNFCVAHDVHRCTKCLIVQSLDNFYRSGVDDNRPRPICKSCHMLEAHKRPKKTYKPQERSYFETPDVKECSKCRATLSKDCFYVNKYNVTGLRSQCKECMIEKMLARHRYLYKNDPGHRVLMLSRYNLDPQVRKKQLDYAKTEKGKAKNKAYRRSTKGRATLARYQKTYAYKLMRRRWYDRTADKRRSYQRTLYARTGGAYDKQRKSRPEYKQWRRQYMARYMSKPEHKLAHSLRNRLGAFISKNSRSDQTLQLLGCDVLTFMGWLQQHFTPLMTWNNYGTYWNLDHQKPMKYFDLMDAEQRKVCCHYKNILPMTVEDNCAKGDMLPCGTRARRLRLAVC